MKRGRNGNTHVLKQLPCAFQFDIIMFKLISRVHRAQMADATDFPAGLPNEDDRRLASFGMDCGHLKHVRARIPASLMNIERCSLHLFQQCYAMPVTIIFIDWTREPGNKTRITAAFPNGVDSDVPGNPRTMQLSQS